MTARAFLLQSVQIREKLKYLNDRIEKIRAELGYHPIQLDDSGASHLNFREDKLLEKVSELVELEEKYKAEVLRLEKKNAEIRAKIELLDNVEYRAILTARYLTENKKNPCRLNPWVAVAFTLGMTSEEAVKQKHKRALRIFEKNFLK